MGNVRRPYEGFLTGPYRHIRVPIVLFTDKISAAILSIKSHQIICVKIQSCVE